MRTIALRISLLLATTLAGCYSAPTTGNPAVHRSVSDGQVTHVRGTSASPADDYRTTKFIEDRDGATRARDDALAYGSRSAGALVFDPPMVQYAAPVYLGREGREASAFYGYEQPVVEGYYLYQRDSQYGYRYDGGFNRTAYTTRSSVTVR